MTRRGECLPCLLVSNSPGWGWESSRHACAMVRRGEEDGRKVWRLGERVGRLSGQGNIGRPGGVTGSQRAAFCSSQSSCASRRHSAPCLACQPFTKPASCPAPPTSLCSKERAESFDFVVIATGLFSIPSRPEWAEGLVSATPPAKGAPWVVDVKDFTEDQLPLAKVSMVIMKDQAARPSTLQGKLGCGRGLAPAILPRPLP